MKIDLTPREQRELGEFLGAISILREKMLLVLSGIVASRDITGSVKLSDDATHITVEGDMPKGVASELPSCPVGDSQSSRDNASVAASRSDPTGVDS